MTPLIAVIAVIVVVVVVGNVIQRARAGRRNVRSHHRALDTLGHITNQRPGHDTAALGASEVRQAHVRVVSADAEVLPAPRPLTGGWRPTRATGAAPFRKPPPRERHDLWDDPGEPRRVSDAAMPEQLSVPSPVEQVRIVGHEVTSPPAGPAPCAVSTEPDKPGAAATATEPARTRVAVPEAAALGAAAPRADVPETTAPEATTPGPASSAPGGAEPPAPPGNDQWLIDHDELDDDAVARAWHDAPPADAMVTSSDHLVTDSGGAGAAGWATGAVAESAAAREADGDGAPQREDWAPQQDRAPQQEWAPAGAGWTADGADAWVAQQAGADGAEVAASFDDVAPGAEPVTRRPLGAYAGHRPGASPPLPGRTDLTALASGPAARRTHARRRAPSRRTLAVSSTVAVLIAVGVVLFVTHHQSGSQPASARVTSGHHATTAPKRATPTTTPTTAALPVRLISSSPGTSLYQLVGTSQITVTSAGPCWIEIRRTDAQGAVVYSETMADGTVETVTGPVWVRLGNPTAVRVTVDGAQVSPPVTQGEPYDLEFQ